MSELITKLSSYNLFNYLFPGVIYIVLLEYWTSVKIDQEDYFLNGFLAYFIGLVISRFGSLVIEPILRKFNFLDFTDYTDFVKAEKEDDKIHVLSEANNTYRTLLALFVVLISSKLFLILSEWLCLCNQDILSTVAVALLFMFLFSYRKQTNYITKRIKTYKL